MGEFGFVKSRKNSGDDMTFEGIFTYTGEQLRPFCPACGREVATGEVDQTEPWLGACRCGKRSWFQYEEEDLEEEPDPDV